MTNNPIMTTDILARIIDQLPTSIFVKNAQLEFELSNAAHCEMIGQPSEKLLGFSDADFYPPAEAAGFLERDRRVLDTGETIESIETATSHSGKTTPVLTRKSKLVTTDGKVYLIGTNTDLTELRKRDERYRALAEAVPVGVWQVAETGETIFANSRFFCHCGLLGNASAGLDTYRSIFAEQLGFPGAAGNFEADIAGRRVLVISSGWLPASDGGNSSAVVSTIDMTETVELRRINDEITRLNRELADNIAKLKEAQDEITRKGRMAQLGHLTATVAHEIRNPLGAVRTAAFLIERKTKGKNLGVEQHLQRVANGINRCDAIITQLLDFSRIKSLEKETVILDDWLAKLVQEEAKNLPPAVSLRCELGLGSKHVEIDPVQMGRAIINLMANAAEAMVGKGDDPEKFTCAAPEITITSRLTSRGIDIVVSDNGPGIAQENLARILEPLFTTKSFGTGLGLPAVEKVAQNHGGGLLVANQSEGGASFTVWLPGQASGIEEAA